MLADSLQKKPFFSSVTELATNRPAHKRHTDDWATPRPGTHETHHPEPSKQTKPNALLSRRREPGLGLSFPTLPLRSQVSTFSLDDFLFFPDVIKLELFCQNKNTLEFYNPQTNEDRILRACLFFCYSL
jgi:hypothetical protein